MLEKLHAAFDLAENIRYSGDTRISLQSLSGDQTEKISRQFAQSGLRISKKLTPDIFEVFENVFSRLKININSITAYVYSSPETQATCFSDNRQECLIWVTSSLIKLMSKEELAFVIGHEIGHFLFGHNIEEKFDNESDEYLIRSRAQEISVDRVGIIACGSLNIAIQALMKLISGLDDKLLRFDVGTFLDQMKNQRGETILHEGENSTHPSLIMRCRALVWFSMSNGFLKTGGEELIKIDQRITTDSEKYVDGPARERIADAKKTLTMWLAALAAVRDGVMDKSDQKIIQSLVGVEMLKKLLNLYSEQSRNEVLCTTKEKLIDALNHYQKIAPMDYRTNLPILEEQLSIDFNQPDFSSFVSKSIQGLLNK